MLGPSLSSRSLLGADGLSERVCPVDASLVLAAPRRRIGADPVELEKGGEAKRKKKKKKKETRKRKERARESKTIEGEQDRRVSVKDAVLKGLGCSARKER